jgi:enamine deaminase RidA (YjgF/YER057c/UK114 family)
VIVGYLGDNDEPYCAECWSKLANAGRKPVMLLTTETGERRDNFRIIDDCRECKAKIDYEDTTDCRGRRQRKVASADSAAPQLISSGSPYEEAIGFSRAVRVGDLVVVSGTAPIGDDGETVCIGDLYLQTRRCIEVAEQALEKAGACLADVVRTRILLTCMESWKEAARAHQEAFGAVRPASTFVQVAGFIDPDWLVEIEVDAVVSSRPPRGVTDGDRPGVARRDPHGASRR